MRIISGAARGCRLKSPKGLRTRPTSDRVRESLFSILGASVRDAEVLDLFAGTGSLGLEALSRGAARAVFVDRATFGLVRENAEHARLIDRAEIIRGDAIDALARLEGRVFDLVFCDPPYGKGLWERVLPELDRLGLLAVGGVLAVEHGAGESLPAWELRSMSLAREISYGHTTGIWLFNGRDVP